MKRRISIYPMLFGEYKTGDGQEYTSEYTWEDLFACSWVTTTEPTSPDYRAADEIKRYFYKHPDRAICGRYQDATPEQIRQLCSY